MPHQTQEQVEGALNSFLQVFSQLKLEEMLEHFSNDATAFLPVSPDRVHLHKGKQEISDYFDWFIKRVKSSGRSSMRLVPEELEVQILSDHASIITFNIIGDSILRRTFVLKKTGNNWLICHLHASSAPLQHARIQ
jgi:hypothetical protein